MTGTSYRFGSGYTYIDERNGTLGMVPRYFGNRAHNGIGNRHVEHTMAKYVYDIDIETFIYWCLAMKDVGERFNSIIQLHTANALR